MPVTGIAQMERDLTVFASVTVPEQVYKRVERVANAVLDGIVSRTPVDTGLARGNWQPTYSVPASGPTEFKDRQPLGAPPSAITKARLAAALQAFKAGGLTGTIYITNRLKYILALEHGHSRSQAPFGMVDRTVGELKQRFATYVR